MGRTPNDDRSDSMNPNNENNRGQITVISQTTDVPGSRFINRQHLKIENRRMKISRYTHEHEDALISALGKDPDWDMFTNEQSVTSYKKRLLESVTYVCLESGVLCGYVRALLDESFGVYISELMSLI